MSVRSQSSYLNLLMIAVSITTVGAVNIALNKPASQVSDGYGSRYPASRAVNGIKSARDSNNIDDYSQTGSNGNVRWWKVNLEEGFLIKNVIIYNRIDVARDYLSNVYILTSNKPTPADPSPVSDDWIIRHYHYGQIGTGGNNPYKNFTLYTTDTVRHVAVYLHHIECLTLREVEVYDYSHSEDSPVNQIDSSTVGFNGTVTSPTAAVDGRVNMFTSSFTTVNYQSSWMVKLKQPCGSFCYVRVFPRLIKNQFNPAEFTKLSRLQTLTYGRETLPAQSGWSDNCDFYEFPQKGPLLQICEATAIWFICLFNFDQGAIEFTEVQVFSQEPAVFQVNLKNQNYGCVNISTSPAVVNRASHYRWKCTSKEWSDRMLSSSVQSCGHEPGSAVTCQIAAVGEGGVNQSQPETIVLTDCGAPADASFVVRDIGANSDQTARKIKISNIMVQYTNCNSLITLRIDVNEMNGGNVKSVTRTTDFYQEETVSGLKAYTDYTVTIYVTNNRQKTSMNSKNIKTGELAPGPVNSLTVQGSSSSCVNVNWSPPDKPNGVIITYTISCTGKSAVNQTETSRRVCGYQPYQNVTCTVRTANSFSGEQRTATGNTWCDKPNSPTFSLSQETSGSSLSRFIKVSDISLSIEHF